MKLKQLVRIAVLVLIIVGLLIIHAKTPLGRKAFVAKIYLKNGTTMEGTLLKETEDSVLLKLDLSRGSGRVKIAKGRIESMHVRPRAMDILTAVGASVTRKVKAGAKGIVKSVNRLRSMIRKFYTGEGTKERSLLDR